MFSGMFSEEEGFTPRASSSNLPREVELEVSLEELFSGATKSISVPHRVRVAGSPLAYLYRHSYAVQLKAGWKDGTVLKYPPVDVMLKQIGGVRIPAVTIKLRVAPHPDFERIGDDLIRKVSVPASQVTRGSTEIAKHLPSPHGSYLATFQAVRNLRVTIKMLDGTLLKFETRGRISHGTTQEFLGRGMPIFGGQGFGKLYVQFQVKESGL